MTDVGRKVAKVQAHHETRYSSGRIEISRLRKRRETGRGYGRWFNRLRRRINKHLLRQESP